MIIIQKYLKIHHWKFNYYVIPLHTMSFHQSQCQFAFNNNFLFQGIKHFSVHVSYRISLKNIQQISRSFLLWKFSIRLKNKNKNKKDFWDQKICLPTIFPEGLKKKYQTKSKFSGDFFEILQEIAPTNSLIVVHVLNP